MSRHHRALASGSRGFWIVIRVAYQDPSQLAYRLQFAS